MLASSPEVNYHANSSNRELDHPNNSSPLNNLNDIISLSKAASKKSSNIGFFGSPEVKYLQTKKTRTHYRVAYGGGNDPKHRCIVSSGSNGGSHTNQSNVDRAYPVLNFQTMKDHQADQKEFSARNTLITKLNTPGCMYFRKLAADDGSAIDNRLINRPYGNADALSVASKRDALSPFLDGASSDAGDVKRKNLENYMEQLRNIIEEKDAKLSDQQSFYDQRLAFLEDDLNNTIAVNQDLQHNNQSLDSERIRLENLVNKLSEERKALLSKDLDLNEQLQSTTQEKKISDLKLKELETELRLRNNENDLLKKRTAELDEQLQIQTSGNEAAQLKVHSLNLRINEINDSLEKSKKRNHDYEIKITEITERFTRNEFKYRTDRETQEELENEVARLRRRLRDSDQEKSELQSEMDKLNDQLKFLKSKLDQESIQWDDSESISQLHDKIGSLNAELKLARTQLGKLSLENDELATENERLTKQMSKIDTETRDFEREIESLHKINSQLNIAKNKLEAANQELMDKHELLVLEKENFHNRLQKKYDELQNLSTSEFDLRDRFEAQATLLHIKQIENNQLTANQQALTDQLEEIKKAKFSAESSYEDQIFKLKSKNKTLKTDIQTLKDEKISQEKQLAAEIQDLKQKILELEAKQNFSRDVETTQNKTIKELKSKVRDLEETVESQQSRIQKQKEYASYDDLDKEITLQERSLRGGFRADIMGSNPGLDSESGFNFMTLPSSAHLRSSLDPLFKTDTVKSRSLRRNIKLTESEKQKQYDDLLAVADATIRVSRPASRASNLVYDSDDQEIMNTLNQIN